MSRNVARLLLAAAVSTLSWSAADALAQAYPAKPIRLLVGFTPGGTTDILAREIAARMQENWARSVVVENRPGAGANIASEVVAKAPPDGYTLLVATNSIAINPAIYTKLPFEPFADFAPISFLGSVTNILFAHPSLPAKSIKELIALAKARPRQITYGSGGVGTSPHLAVELFRTLAKIDIVHVPYKGVPPVVQGLLSGEVAMGVASLPSAGLPGLVNSGRIRGLALTGAKRAGAVPSVPTMAESGFPGFDVVIWYGLLAPAGTAADIIGRLNKEMIRIMTLPAVRERMAAFDFEIATSSPEDFGSFFKKELAQWAKVVKDAGVKPVN
ncbi:MAG: tripartite tricarboxylate transporter substrate binding protein [Burkholderiales bacterium]|nr:tripartite tricarboxylate transporter substrate binding protein [Burkholderiales bacterium]